MCGCSAIGSLLPRPHICSQPSHAEARLFRLLQQGTCICCSHRITWERQDRGGTYRNPVYKGTFGIIHSSITLPTARDQGWVGTRVQVPTPWVSVISPTRLFLNYRRYLLHINSTPINQLVLYILLFIRLMWRREYWRISFPEIGSQIAEKSQLFPLPGWSLPHFSKFHSREEDRDAGTYRYY